MGTQTQLSKGWKDGKDLTVRSKRQKDLHFCDQHNVEKAANNDRRVKQDNQRPQKNELYQKRNVQG